MGRSMPLAFQARAVAIGLVAWALAGAVDAQGAGQQNVDDVIAKILERDPATAAMPRKPVAKPAATGQQRARLPPRGWRLFRPRRRRVLRAPRRSSSSTPATAASIPEPAA